ncbi:uncharacterized protein [Vulpes vulpes]|uniref:Collagen alpha-1(I) chain-like n=1 Tax=Vulpes vulpes TaxID=9627 RepID=A0ABM4YCQ5_VULVU
MREEEMRKDHVKLLIVFLAECSRQGGAPCCRGTLLRSTPAAGHSASGHPAPGSPAPGHAAPGTCCGGAPARSGAALTRQGSVARPLGAGCRGRGGAAAASGQGGARGAARSRRRFMGPARPAPWSGPAGRSRPRSRGRRAGRAGPRFRKGGLGAGGPDGSCSQDVWTNASLTQQGPLPSPERLTLIPCCPRVATKHPGLELCPQPISWQPQ